MGPRPLKSNLIICKSAFPLANFFKSITPCKNWRGGALSLKNGAIDGYGLLTIARAGFAQCL